MDKKELHQQRTRHKKINENVNVDNYRFGCTLWRTAFHDSNIAERNPCILWLQTEFVAQHCEMGKGRESGKMAINSDAILIINANV